MGRAELRLLRHSCNKALRSTKDKDNNTQVDIVFKNIDLMHIPVIMHRLSALELSVLEIQEEEFLSMGIVADHSSWSGQMAFKLEGDNWQGIIIAGGMFWVENDAHYNDENEWMLIGP